MSAPGYAALPVELPDRFADAGDLTHRRALVTGGGRGLGLAIACALGQAGAAVAIAGRNRETLETGLIELQRRGCNAIALEGDVSLAEPAQRLVREAAARLDGLDILVNNAGLGARSAPEDLTEQQFDAIFATNVKSVYFASCEAMGIMRGKGGAIVNLSSVLGRVADIELAAYCASKAAVIDLTEVLAVAWGALGIRVNAVAPGYTDSPMNAHRKADPAKAEAIVGSTPLARWGRPADVADAVLFLASDAASFLTGQTVYCDGGFSLNVRK
ncbi:MAG: SDR family NAD(P)-dependent oxidoreductase [Chloroflexota bacterium]